MAASRSPRTILMAFGAVIVVGILAALYLVAPPGGRSPASADLQKEAPKGQIATLETMWKNHPTHAPIALQLGNLYADQNQPEKAVFYYREFLKLDTSSTGWEVRLDIAKALYAMSRLAEARTELQWILNRDPNHAAALYNLGAIEANSGHPDQARKYWEQLIAKHPDDSLAQTVKESLKQLK